MVSFEDQVVYDVRAAHVEPECCRLCDERMVGMVAELEAKYEMHQVAFRAYARACGTCFKKSDSRGRLAHIALAGLKKLMAGTGSQAVN